MQAHPFNPPRAAAVCAGPYISQTGQWGRNPTKIWMAPDLGADKKIGVAGIVLAKRSNEGVLAKALFRLLLKRTAAGLPGGGA